jgi:hypothetical protein
MRDEGKRKVSAIKRTQTYKFPRANWGEIISGRKLDTPIHFLLVCRARPGRMMLASTSYDTDEEQVDRGHIITVEYAV